MAHALINERATLAHHVAASRVVTAPNPPVSQSGFFLFVRHRRQLQYLPRSRDVAYHAGHSVGCAGRAAMAEKVVDVFLKDSLVASYLVVVDRLDVAISEQDFIELARSAMQENGYAAEDIAEAKFSVRSVPE
jgi:hypothetical protein